MARFRQRFIAGSGARHAVVVHRFRNAVSEHKPWNAHLCDSVPAQDAAAARGDLPKHCV
jgi:hypothetical protein